MDGAATSRPAPGVLPTQSNEPRPRASSGGPGTLTETADGGGGSERLLLIHRGRVFQVELDGGRNAARVFDLVLENKSGSGASSLRKLDGVPWSIGLVEPLDLLTYRPFDGAPEHCRTPDSLFAEVRAAVNGSDTHCSATTQAPLAGAAGMHLTCHYAEQTRCDHRYEALLWAERMGGGTVEYVVRGFSWASRSCPDGAYAASKEVHDAAEAVSQRWEQLARRCDARAAR